MELIESSCMICLIGLIGILAGGGRRKVEGGSFDAALPVESRAGAAGAGAAGLQRLEMTPMSPLNPWVDP